MLFTVTKSEPALNLVPNPNLLYENLSQVVFCLAVAERKGKPRHFLEIGLRTRLNLIIKAGGTFKARGRAKPGAGPRLGAGPG